MPRTLNLTHAECVMLIRAVRRCAAHDHNEHAKVADALYDRLVELDTRGGLTLTEAAAPVQCGGVLAYETIGPIRIHKDGVFRYLCPKCKKTGTNNGVARVCE